jgi:hypothetical protein
VGVEQKNDPFHLMTLAISMPAFYDTNHLAVGARHYEVIGYLSLVRRKDASAIPSVLVAAFLF